MNYDPNKRDFLDVRVTIEVASGDGTAEPVVFHCAIARQFQYRLSPEQIKVMITAAVENIYTVVVKANAMKPEDCEHFFKKVVCHAMQGRVPDPKEAYDRVKVVEPRINPAWVEAGEGPHADYPGQRAPMIRVGSPPCTCSPNIRDDHCPVHGKPPFSTPEPPV